MPLWPKQQREDNYRDYYITNVELWYEKTLTPPILTSGVWSLANRIVYTPVKLPRASQWFPAIQHGAVVSGLYIVGIYGDDTGKPGTRLFQTPIGAQGTASRWAAPLVIDGLYGGNGLYWLAAAFDNTTAEVIRIATLAAGGIGQVANIYYEDRATLELPATATPLLASIALGSVPVMSIYGV